MKKIVIASLVSFVVGGLLTASISYYSLLKIKEIENAIRIPAEISNTQSYIRLLDEAKHAGLREHFIENLRCSIRDLEIEMDKNENFSSPESFEKVKEKALKYTSGKPCARY